MASALISTPFNAGLDRLAHPSTLGLHHAGVDRPGEPLPSLPLTVYQGWHRSPINPQSSPPHSPPLPPCMRLPPLSHKLPSRPFAASLRSAIPAPTPCPCSCRPSRRPRRHAPALAVVRHAARQLCRHAGRPGTAPRNALAGHAAWLRCSKPSEGHPALTMPPYPCSPAGRRSVAPAAIAAPERTSVYESIKQNSEFPPETAVRLCSGPQGHPSRLKLLAVVAAGGPQLPRLLVAAGPCSSWHPPPPRPASPALHPQFPWGFQPPKGFKLPHYVPRTPASVPTPKQLGYTMPGEACLWQLTVLVCLGVRHARAPAAVLPHWWVAPRLQCNSNGLACPSPPWCPPLCLPTLLSFLYCRLKCRRV